MGVTGLWTVVQPCARPIKIETLNRKRLAVDASIWIYQFLKAVRDKEGNALRNSHVVGFFRRICKLLFIGIQPVFVFDGGAPALKRQTISARRSRREGRKEDAVRTAGKLLALQMQRAAEEEEQKRKDAARPQDDEEEAVPENPVYVEELQMTQQERQQNRKFRKKDQYHLPDLQTSFAEMGQPDDPRMMSLEELETYARQFDTGEDINVYDFSKIDFDSPFFTSLPASDRYNILNAARLRSRLRMGHSKEQLESMFPDRMAFSKFQIERVTERNELTQRLMNLNGMNEETVLGMNGRVAGEKGREYILVKNDGVEGGWALGVVSNKDEGVQSKPIDVDKLDNDVKMEEDEEEDDEDDFEDVPIEGLNRLPKLSGANQNAARPPKNFSRQRRALYASRKKQNTRPKKVAQAPRTEDPDSLFVAEAEPEQNEVDEEADDNGTDDEELQRAIAMSMGHDPAQEEADAEAEQNDEDFGNDYLEVFQQQKRAEDARPIPKGSMAAIARTVNQRAAKAAPKLTPQPESDSGSEDDVDFGSALAKSNAVKPKPDRSRPSVTREASSLKLTAKPSVPKPKNASGFDGPLPFEKLDLGSSLLGKKKMQEMQQSTAGGFDKDTDKKNEAQPLPPWFAGDLQADIAAQKQIEADDRQKAKEFQDTQKFVYQEPSVLRRRASNEVIDVDAPESAKPTQEVIDLDDMDDIRPEQPGIEEQLQDEAIESTTMGTNADALKAAPFQVSSPSASHTPPVQLKEQETAESSAITNNLETLPDKPKSPASTGAVETAPAAAEEQIDWSESENEATGEKALTQPREATTQREPPETATSRSPSPDFEDVEIPEQVEKQPEPNRQAELQKQIDEQTKTMNHVSGTADQNAPVNDDAEDYGYYSDSEDEELMRQLAVEAEEHARFASELNHKTQQQNIQEYERELKQLRNQQKKDRRDADEVTHIMISECQQLLKLFGLPYVTAPMEAEAQCAELVRLGLVDGIVTDDSDCFLFGGTRIYKNMFNQGKFVECYLASDLEKEFDLTRQKLIGIAQLLGSDYTEGLPGVGPVSALEILSDFPTLNDFKDWWSKVQMNEITKADDAGNPFRRKFRKNATKLFLPASFPDPRVDMAYMQPEVDNDPSDFQWGVPDLNALRSFLMATIGWSQERTDEVLVPVIRDMNQRAAVGTQTNITKFFAGGTGAGAYAPRVRLEQGSKRMGTALSRMASKAKSKRKGAAVEEVPEEIEAEAQEKEKEQEQLKKRPQRKRKQTAPADEAEDAESEQSAPKKKRGGRKKQVVAEDDD
ncbi:hypothetical protein MBLNU457_4498t1 [Dothideomycetes sp. NU457]